jgi:hypothetical protein
MDDRNYYRRLDDYELLELAKHVNTAELSVVLAERLKKTRTKLATLLGDEDDDALSD